MVIGLFGIPVTARVAGELVPLATYGWRLTFVWGSLGLLIFLFAKKIEESPRWFESHGRFAEADAVLDRIEARTIAEFGSLPAVGENLHSIWPDEANSVIYSHPPMSDGQPS